MNNLIDMLADTEVFGKFTPPEREELARLATRRVLKRGSILCRQGEPWPFVFYIVAGTFKSVIGSPDGRIYVVSTWEKGVEFWGHTLFDGEEMPSTTEVIKDTIGYQWQGEEVLKFVFRNSEVVRALLHRQTQLIRKRRESIYNLAFNPVASRLAKLVVNKFVNAKGQSVQRDLTLEDMASMTATSPEVICRILYQFQDEGFLSVNRASITLHNRSALEKLIIQD